MWALLLLLDQKAEQALMVVDRVEPMQRFLQTQGLAVLVVTQLPLLFYLVMAVELELIVTHR
jgi:hypothetical protein